MASVVSLREQHPAFRFVSSTWEVVSGTLLLTFRYQIEHDISFTHTVTFTNIDPERVAKLPPALLDRLSFSLGMITSFSYWKTTASPNIIVQAGLLNTEQLAWWHTLLIESMGEYFFVNDIDCTPDDFVTITADAAYSASTPVESDAAPDSSGAASLNLTKPFVVPLGGGKDSAVSLELITAFTNPTKPAVLLFQAPQAAQEIAAASQSPETIVIERTFDPLLLELNQRGYLNGHTPFSAMLAFTSVFAGVLYGYQSIVLSNEHSANEGNIVFHGKEINHQYSKSFAFEQSFQIYCQTFLFPEYALEEQPRYFSFLRPLFELQIGALFAPLEKYHHSFRSCNRGQTTNTWCGVCPKCLFAYLITFPFMPWGKPQEVFGKDMFADMALLETAQELLGIGEKKPLECVGTYEESMVAAYLSVQRYRQNNTPLPPLLDWIASTVLPTQTHLPERATAILRHFEPQHALPKPLEHFLKKQLFNPFETLKHKEFVIFGLGREGRSLLEFLRTSFPNQKITIADDAPPMPGGDATTPGDNAANDELHILTPDQVTVTTNTVIFKSPGIPPTHPAVIEWVAAGALLHSATQLFFELLTTLETPPLVIGVTGTKGKSTTTAMIAHVLTEAGKEVLLGGNIGIPALELWKQLVTSSVPPIVVLELSAHQLAGLTFSPNFAVIQNITPEHLDYYSDFAEYVAAKTHIVSNQTPDDFVVYNLSLETPTQVAHRSLAHHLPFSAEPLPQSICYVTHGAITYQNDVVIPTDELPLTGAHNHLNVMPAIIIAKQFGVPTETIAAGIRSFTPLPHRLQLVRTIAGTAYYNDSLATTPEATIAALQSFTGHPVVLIAGGTNRNLDFTALVDYLKTSSVVGLVLFPPTGETIAKLLAQQSLEIPHKMVHSMPEAVAAAQEFAGRTQQTVVLLSPGSASFGLFTDYADRGNQFLKEVANLS